MQKISLTAAAQFAQQRLADCAVGLAPHEGLDRQSLLRRSGDHREVADAFQAHRQRARNRGGGQGQHVDLGAQRLEGFFLAHAESMLLVDDDQPEPLEDNVAAEQLVRADHDVDRAVGHAIERGSDLLGRAKPRELGQPQRPVRESV